MRPIDGARARSWSCAGPGNNGGDGFVAARYLARAGAEVVVGARLGLGPALDRGRGPELEPARPRAAGHAHPRSIARDLGVLAKDIERASVVVDALLGTGVQGELRDPIRSAVELIARARAAKVPVVAVDTPTAVDLTSGDPTDPVVQADSP